MPAFAASVDAHAYSLDMDALLPPSLGTVSFGTLSMGFTLVCQELCPLVCVELEKSPFLTPQYAFTHTRT